MHTVPSNTTSKEQAVSKGHQPGMTDSLDRISQPLCFLEKLGGRL